MNQYLLEIQRYFEEKYQFELPAESHRNGDKYLTITYPGEPPLKSRAYIRFEDSPLSTRPYIHLNSGYSGITIPPEKYGEALELINYINRGFYSARLYLEVGKVRIRSHVPKEIALSDLGPVCEKLAEEMRDMFWRYEAQFRLMAAPAAPAPAAEEKKWSMDFTQ